MEERGLGEEGQKGTRLLGRGGESWSRVEAAELLHSINPLLLTLMSMTPIHMTVVGLIRENNELAHSEKVEHLLHW